MREAATRLQDRFLFGSDYPFITPQRWLKDFESHSYHAHGAIYHGSSAGSFGDVGCFSFYPTKAFGAFGDAGAIVTNDAEIDARLRQLRYMGQKIKHNHEIIGYQKRMDELQAAI